jgi:hypothetical protein
MKDQKEKKLILYKSLFEINSNLVVCALFLYLQGEEMREESHTTKLHHQFNPSTRSSVHFI